jgi:hypothetical protein
MPYSCALAVCTTFCAHIAPALIPIFGPTFPSQCVPPEAPEHGRMTIDKQLVLDATSEAETYRLQYSTFSPKSLSSTRESFSPSRSIRSDRIPEASMRRTPPQLGRRLRLKRTFGDGASLYGTPTEAEMDTNGSESSSGDGGAYFHSPITPGSVNSTQAPGWQTDNMLAHSANSSININMSPPFKCPSGPNPLLSAIPRSSGLVDMPLWCGKRRVEEVDADDEYDGEESASVTDEKESMSVDEKSSDKEMEDVSRAGAGGGGGGGAAEKKAAWLLMKLSVKDGECGVGMREREEGPRIKRMRATSM